MLNKKVILLCGFSRGGTNIVWNLLQSHPKICSPIYETGTILHKRDPIRFSRIVSLLNRAGLLYTWIGRRIVDVQLYRYKLRNRNHPDNRYISEGVFYNRKQIAHSTLCLKSVDNDIDHTGLLQNIYPGISILLLARNGYAIADGHIRRGKTAAEAGELYNRIAMKMKSVTESLVRIKLIRFENALEDPFGISEELFRFTNTTPHQLDKLRLKSKKTLDVSDSHYTRYGDENRKYWFDRSTIGNILDPDINRTQASRLQPDMIRDFNREASDAMNYFGYPILDPEKPV
ncbi:MAG: hypothetical protein WD355_06535 [Balneolaceae bacterium]